MLTCPYCGTAQPLPDTGRSVQEHSYAQWVATASDAAPVSAPGLRSANGANARLGAHVFECQNCKASTESDDISRRCPFCGSPLVRDVSGDAQVQPEGIVAFVVDHAQAQAAVAQWIHSRRFAPSALRKIASTEGLAGTYLPFWTYDAPTRTTYDGQRGEHYWVTETYTVMVDGRPQARTRQVQHIRWHAASGTVSRNFDDVLVPATTHVERKRLDTLEPWDTVGALPYQRGYLAGHQTLRYDTPPDAGLTEARRQMEAVIGGDVRTDIGGDEQRVHRMDVRYGEIRWFDPNRARDQLTARTRPWPQRSMARSGQSHPITSPTGPRADRGALPSPP